MKLTLKVQNKRGLHARAAGKFVKTASLFQSQVTVEKANLQADGLSIMELLMLQAAQHETLTLRAKGPDSELALQALQQLVQNKFGEVE